jgi:anti-anti-sigma factor
VLALEPPADNYGLTVEVRKEPGHVLVTVAGEVDIATVPQLRERLAAPAASGRPLIVDLDGVTFIDAAGLRVLASAARRAAARGASLHAVCARHQVHRLFTITVLDRQIPLARTVTEGGRRVVPGLNDSHLHAIRGGLFFNLELRWDGVGSVERGLEMIREQAKRTPQGQWVRVIGGWSPYQFAEKRMPAVTELTEAAPATPALVLFAYSQVLLNAAGVSALGLTPDSVPAGGGRYDFADGGVIVTGTAAAYATIAGLPGIGDRGDQLNSTRHFLRELNRFGITSTVGSSRFSPRRSTKPAG